MRGLSEETSQRVLASCPEGAVIKLGRGKRYRFHYDLCTGCAVCRNQCPCHAIEMIPEPETAPEQAAAGQER